MLISQISDLVNPLGVWGGFGPDAALLGVLTGIQTLLECSRAQQHGMARCVYLRKGEDELRERHFK